MAKNEEKGETKEMGNQEEKTKTKNATTEATSKDNVDALVEKTLAAEKKRTKSERKIAWIAAGLCLFSIICLDLIAHSNEMTNPGVIIGVMTGVIVGITIGIIIIGDITGGILGGMIGGIIGGNSTFVGGANILSGIIGGIIGGTVGPLIDGIFGGILTKKRISNGSMVLLSIVFLLPFAPALVPLSKYHNQNQIERDKKIVETLEITVLEDGIEILLPSKYASKNSYLKKVFSFGWYTREKQVWKDIVIPCREGDKYWYKAKLPFPTWYEWKLEKESSMAVALVGREKYGSNADNIILFFDHAWEDYKITKEISFQDPDPNSL